MATLNIRVRFQLAQSKGYFGGYFALQCEFLKPGDGFVEIPMVFCRCKSAMLCPTEPLIFSEGKGDARAAKNSGVSWCHPVV